MHVLVIGFGSIGKRHIRNLMALPEIQKITVLTQMDVSPLTVTLSHEGRGDEIALKAIRSLDDISSLGKIDFAVVANQTTRHMATCQDLAQLGIPLFLEKPVAADLKGCDELVKTVTAKNIPVFVAYNLRFLGCMTKVREWLGAGVLGKLCFAHIESGFYLPAWRPGTDYRKCYSAIKAQGGGVALDLSHEVDTMYSLFGAPHRWHVFKNKVSTLEIDSDDLFEGIYQYPDGFVCHIHLDYLQLTKKRQFVIVGEKGEISCDVAGQKLQLKTPEHTETLVHPELFDVPRTYIHEINHFLEVLSGAKASLITVEDGLNVLKLLSSKS